MPSYCSPLETTGSRPSNNLRPSLPRAAKTSSRPTIDHSDTSDLNNTEDSDSGEDSSTIICEVPSTFLETQSEHNIHDANSLDPTTLIALLAQENTEPQNRKDLRLNALLGLMAKVTLAEANPTEPFQPRNFKEAITDHDYNKWTGAIQEEFNSLKDNKTWELVDRPSDQRVLQGKWIYRHKRGPHGEIIRYKARWVIRGDQQKEGVDYTETFATVVKPMSYKLIFAIAAALDWEIDQMDVKTAFLYGLVEETVYMQQPLGLEDKSAGPDKPLDADASVFHKKGVKIGRASCRERV